MRPKIFISYTMRDLLITETKLRYYESIYSQFGKVYIDYLHNKAEDHQFEVIRNLINSDIVILIYSPQLMMSPWVRLEISVAKSLNKLIFITSPKMVSNKPIKRTPFSHLAFV